MRKLAFRMDNIIVFIILAILKSIIFLYDLVTLPIYSIFQQPWKKWPQKPKIWGSLTDKSNPWSPYRSIREAKTTFKEFGTLDALFRKAVQTNGNAEMFGTRETFSVNETVTKDGKVLKKLVLGDYKWTTLNEADKKVTNIAQGLRHLGMNPRDKIVILAETRFEWLLVAEACFRTNITVATCYTNLGEDGMVIGINEAETNYLVTSSELLNKIKPILPRLQTIKYIIYFEDFKAVDLSGFPDNVKSVPFKELVASGENENYELEAPTPTDIAILMYTSGSTAAPKGVLIPHKSILNTLQGMEDVSREIFLEGKFVAYLPLAHMYELIAETVCILCNVPIGYSSPLTITDKSTGIQPGCKGDVNLLKPTVLASVPLMLDRIRKNVNEVVESKGKLSKHFFNHSIKYKQFWKKFGFETPILDKLVFDNIRQLLGGRVKYVTSGSAPLSSDTHQFIETCLGVKMIQGYALTETGASGTLAQVGDDSIGRVGPPFPTCLLRLVDWDEGGYHPTDKPYPRGEVVVGGDSITAGYYKNEEATKESYKTENGIRWFYTGDIAEVHPDGCFKIIDRKKDLLKLQHGEYVSLGKVEAELKTCPLVDNICVSGNGFLTYVVALVVPNLSQLKNLAKQLNKENLNVKELCLDPDITREATKLIQKHGAQCKLIRTEIPKYITLCSEEWVPESGLVTAALKVRRKMIEQHYRDVLQPMMENKGL